MIHIRQCLIEFADKGSQVARARYIGVAHATWCRWVAAVRRDMEMEAQMAPAATPVTATSGTTDAPSPMDFFEAEMARMRSDIELLRSAATTSDINGNTKLRNPVTMAQAIRLRHAMLALYVQRQEAIVGAGRFASYRELVQGAIKHVLGSGKTEAEVEILGRLRKTMGHAQKQWDAGVSILDPRKAGDAVAAGNQEGRPA